MILIPAVLMLCIALSWLLYLHTKRTSRMERLSATIPGPKNWPIIGYSLEFGLKNLKEEPMDIFHGLIKTYGSIYKTWLGPELFVAISSPEDVGDVLSSDNLEKPFIYKFSVPILGNSIFNLPSKEWRIRRKIIDPAFHFKRFSEFIENFNSNSKILVDTLRNELDKSGFDVDPYCNLCTLDIIIETTLGVQMNYQRNKDMELVHSLHELEVSFARRVMSPWNYLDIVFNISPSGRKQKRLLKSFHSNIKMVINAKMQQRSKMVKQMPTNIKEDDEINGVDSKSFIDMLLDSYLNEEETANEVATIIFTGQTSTASTLSFVLYALMTNQNVQEKVVQELNSIFNGSNRDPTMNDLNKMIYMEQVIKETMRMWTTFPFIVRQITKDIHLRSGHVLPAGCIVTIMLNELHRKETVFTNPHLFDPERFNSENSSGRDSFAFRPFGCGPRNCIGRRFAMFQMKVILTHLLRNYKILPTTDNRPDISLAFETLLRSKTGVHIRIENR